MEQIYDRLEDAQIQDNYDVIDFLLQEDIPLSQPDNLDFNDNFDWLDEILQEINERPDEPDTQDIQEPYTLHEIEPNYYIDTIEGVDPYEEMEAIHTFYNTFNNYLF